MALIKLAYKELGHLHFCINWAKTDELTLTFYMFDSENGGMGLSNEDTALGTSGA